MSTYEPGTVALVSATGVGPEVRLLQSPRSGGGEGKWVGARGFVYDDGSVTDVRPLVTLDFAAAGLSPTVAIREIRDVFSRDSLGWPKIADQIEAQTRPPKPEEPTGLGAVVEDEAGRRYVRHCPGDCKDGRLCIPWHRVTDALNRTYGEFDAVRVLSEGVTA